MQSDVSTFAFGEPYIQKLDPRKTSVLVKVLDMSCLNDKMYADFKKKLVLKIRSKGFTIVEDIGRADLIFSVVLKNFSRIEDSTLANIEKFAQYKDIAAITQPKNYNLSTNSAIFALADQGIAVGTENGVDVRGGGGAFSKLVGIDFASGAAIGALSAFLIAGSNPLTMVLGGVTGAVITSILQVITEPNNYSGSVSIRVAERAKFDKMSSKTKILQVTGNNALTEVEINEPVSWIDYNSDFVIVVSSSSSRRGARKKFARHALYLSGNLL